MFYNLYDIRIYRIIKIVFNSLVRLSKKSKHQMRLCAERKHLRKCCLENSHFPLNKYRPGFERVKWLLGWTCELTRNLSSGFPVSRPRTPSYRTAVRVFHRRSIVSPQESTGNASRRYGRSDPRLSRKGRTPYPTERGRYLEYVPPPISRRPQSGRQLRA